MQVIDQGCGDYIKKGTSVDVLVRFDEYNLSYAAEMSDKCLTLSNKVPAYSYYVDKISVTNTSGTFTGSFVDPSASLMANTYNSSSYGSVSSTVPSGWLIPFTWIKIGRPKTDDERIAHIRQFFIIFPTSVELILRDDLNIFLTQERADRIELSVAHVLISLTIIACGK
jgi:hypothetical protein